MSSPSLDDIRHEVPAVLETAFLNTGTCGPLPRRAFDAARAALDLDFSDPQARIGPGHFPGIGQEKENVREASARALGAEPAEVAVTNSTTDGMYLAIMGLRWQPGDELILSSIEHGGAGFTPAFLAKSRYGLEIRIADLGHGSGSTEEIVAAFQEQITPRTRMIVLSHVSYLTGAELPLKEICGMARRHHVLTVVDAAQSYGALQLDLHDAGCDFYACPGQKWMCGPDGSGVFYVRAESIGFVDSIFNHSGAMGGTLDFHSGSFAPPAGAQRFDTTARNRSLLAAQAASTRWITDDLGLDWVESRVREMAGKTAEALAETPGVEVITPVGRLAGLITFNVDGIEPVDLRNRLVDEHNVTIRSVSRYISNPDAARVSIGFYNNDDDIDRLTEAIKAIQASL